MSFDINCNLFVPLIIFRFRAEQMELFFLLLLNFGCVSEGCDCTPRCFFFSIYKQVRGRLINPIEFIDSPRCWLGVGEDL